MNRIVYYLAIALVLGLMAAQPAHVRAEVLSRQASTSRNQVSNAGSQVPRQVPGSDCSPYYYPPVGEALSQFPAGWTTATILPGDVKAQAKWAKIQPMIPTGIAVKSNTTAYPPGDPDCWWTRSTCTTPKHPGLPEDIKRLPEPKTLGYGFDDGPNCTHNAFYDFLQQHNQKATMFFIGANVLNWPLQAQRALADGHEICAHTWSHKLLTTLPSDQAFAELYYIIKLVIGITPTCWRPPQGDIDDRIRAIAAGLKLDTVMWQYDSNDWKRGTPGVTDADIDRNYTSIISAVRNGSANEQGTIILMHELNGFTMNETMKHYPEFVQVFDHIVPVGVALNKTQPYVESAYHLPTFEQYVTGTTSIPHDIITDDSGELADDDDNGDDDDGDDDLGPDPTQGGASQHSPAMGANGTTGQVTTNAAITLATISYWMALSLVAFSSLINL